ncbi:FAD linked oxidase domain protein [Acidimicrobium ferrooxidans DSM 10331]|uniref:FAD linked oxidase domain protein n=1 Tax=Acidimicrobium ferrooxidans (strain DSM 10331 / JCM 15462 / NBRC 103882 / ICP) TaxID=525909 RepID=C7M0Z8_ACIFD|nr:FAD-binding oxidoreductase [Acidimicrobium ferrooxidans]ACU54656.1 FAD linked oxidase domain protein [Acidimicrobium ferrooxidans DSM 10331]
MSQPIDAATDQAPPFEERWTLLEGWGRTPRSAAWLREATDDAVVDALCSQGPRPVLARGLGRSYGDAALAAGGIVLDMTSRQPVVTLDQHRGVAVVDAGTSLAHLAASVLPHGWFLPVTPGTKHVTVGGAIAADVHGKNHHRDGSFGGYVERLWLATPEGIVELAPPDERFWATVGGMGLTGVILRAAVRLIPVESRFVLDREVATSSLDETIEVLADDSSVRYSVAWLDATATGARLGRGLVSFADHAPADALPASLAHDPLRLPRERTLPAPPDRIPSGLLSVPTIRAFNELWYQRGRRRPETALVDLRSYFYPLDAVNGWNRLYGPRGFVQYQVVVPNDAVSVIRRILTDLVEHGHPSFLSVLKRFGPAGNGWLSFPTAGWTLALDLPARRSDLETLLVRLDALVLEAGGRVYLAKDGRLRPESARAMYTRIDDFQALRARLGVRGVISSDLARRLHLD